VNGGQDNFNPFGINGDIQILLDPKNNKNNRGFQKECKKIFTAEDAKIAE